MAIRRKPSSFRSVLQAISLLAAIGCSQGRPEFPLPKTHPVVGRVVRKSGETPTTSSIEFREISGAGMRAMGEVLLDGSFELKTIARNNDVLKGAVEGAYEVTVYSVGAENKVIDVFMVPKQRTVQAGSNEFVFNIP